MNSQDFHPEKYRHDLEVIRNTAAQIIKDFSISTVEITFSGNPSTAYTELINQVTPALEFLYSEKKETFMGLLYRIDVDEKKLATLMSKGDRTYFSRDLAEIIIEREFIKVLTRKLFR